MAASTTKWDWEIGQRAPGFRVDIRGLAGYRHLIASLIRRDFLLSYQQTVLGPLWILVQPILTLFTYVLVFGSIMGVNTGGLPKVLFYFSGIVLWNFFSDSFLGATNTFRDNIHVFSKVYFPRVIMPLAFVSTQFLRMLIQLALLVLLTLYYIFFNGFRPGWDAHLLYFPVAIFFCGMISFSMGLIFSVLTAKYRDMANLVGIAVRLLMFVTPVIYPLASVHQRLKWVVNINPLTPFFEMFRRSLLGQGSVDPLQMLYGIAFTVLISVAALYLFNRLSPKLIDVI